MEWTALSGNPFVAVAVAVAKRRAVRKPPPPDLDLRQLEIGAPPPSDPPVTRAVTKKLAATLDPGAMAKRAGVRRGADPAGRVRIVVAIKVAAAEALSERAIARPETSKTSPRRS